MKDITKPNRKSLIYERNAQHAIKFKHFFPYSKLILPTVKPVRNIKNKLHLKPYCNERDLFIPSHYILVKAQNWYFFQKMYKLIRASRITRHYESTVRLKEINKRYAVLQRNIHNLF